MSFFPLLLPKTFEPEKRREMKRFAWFLLMLCAVVQPMSKTATCLLFQANRAYISQYLCEQRQQPDSACKGSCYLKKQLKKSEKQSSPTRERQPLQDMVFLAEAFRLQEVLFVAATQAKEPIYTLQVYASPAFCIFHPPKTMA